MRSAARQQSNETKKERVKRGFPRREEDLPSINKEIREAQEMRIEGKRKMKRWAKLILKDNHRCGHGFGLDK